MQEKERTQEEIQRRKKICQMEGRTGGREHDDKGRKMLEERKEGKK